MPAVSFQSDILPLFTQADISHMQGMGVNLNEYSYMSNPTNAAAVYSTLTGNTQPQMPLGGPYWSAAQLQLFQQWMTDGYQP